MEIATPSSSPDRLIALADRLDHFTEHDMLLLADIKPSTLEQWRKRGEGPAYARAGSRFLYPREAVVEWLKTRTRERDGVPAGDVL